MEIIRNNNTFKIKLPPYKVHIKEVKNKNKTGYQYTCILPPFLTSYFNINKETIEENEPNILLYTYNHETYITNTITYREYNNISLKHHALKHLTSMYTNDNMAVPEDLQKQVKELPTLNYKLHDNITNFYHTTAYNMSNSNSFRFTLPNKLFKDKIDITKNNYILFTIDTLEKDVLNHNGVIKIEILQE